jgi:hypothetical protein
VRGVVGHFGGARRAGGAEAVQEAEDKEDERLVGAADVERAVALEGALLEGAADVDAVGVGERAEGSGEVGGEGGFVPDGGGGEESGEEFGGGSGEGADGGGFFSGVAEPLFGNGGLNFENRVDTFGGDVGAGGVREELGRGEVVEDGEVDLAGAAAVAIDDEDGGGAVALGQVTLEELEPMAFGGGALRRAVFEELADGELGEHFLLDAAENFGEVDFSGVVSSRHDPRMGVGRAEGGRVKTVRD